MVKRLKNIKLHKFREIERKVLYYFFSFPQQPTGLSNLSKKLSTSKTATKSAVLRLIEEGFLQKEEVGNAWRILANQKHPFMITKKIPYNLQLVYESGVTDKVYKKIPNARVITLFGSYRWGTDNEKSDVDIAVEVLGKENLKIEPLEGIKQLGLRSNVKVNIHIFSRNKIDINLFTNIANGIILDGLLEVRP